MGGGDAEAGLHVAEAASSSRGDDASSQPPTSARADAGGAAQWAARVRAERCLELVLSLQEAARQLSRNLRVASTQASRNAVDAQRSEVATLREALAADLGLGPTSSTSNMPRSMAECPAATV